MMLLAVALLRMSWPVDLAPLSSKARRVAQDSAEDELTGQEKRQQRHTHEQTAGVHGDSEDEEEGGGAGAEVWPSAASQATTRAMGGMAMAMERAFREVRQDRMTEVEMVDRVKEVELAWTNMPMAMERTSRYVMQGNRGKNGLQDNRSEHGLQDNRSKYETEVKMASRTTEVNMAFRILSMAMERTFREVRQDRMTEVEMVIRMIEVEMAWTNSSMAMERTFRVQMCTALCSMTCPLNWQRKALSFPGGKFESPLLSLCKLIALSCSFALPPLLLLMLLLLCIEPDAEFGGFSVLHGPSEGEFKDQCLVLVDLDSALSVDAVDLAAKNSSLRRCTVCESAMHPAAKQCTIGQGTVSVCRPLSIIALSDNALSVTALCSAANKNCTLAESIDQYFLLAKNALLETAICPDASDCTRLRQQESFGSFVEPAFVVFVTSFCCSRSPSADCPVGPVYHGCASPLCKGRRKADASVRPSSKRHYRAHATMHPIACGQARPLCVSLTSCIMNCCLSVTLTSCIVDCFLSFEGSLDSQRPVFSSGRVHGPLFLSFSPCPPLSVSRNTRLHNTVLDRDILTANCAKPIGSNI
ncbi:hypothetical protein DUNSADRAFT_7612 [Dunaliella salina]|uniref:Uncharacterized protein n=1 Tax=Dunaliella salina TaxID=3046 RepID=A0ABQ7GL06_DUNSA|nr:hypothetical protein DUNSADRAFT_7612 [Dunaliella salina]|eukprot:KAF5835287.1 hypothetical protein DUNSADRAFT_7612 [Dunaliella salina]